MCKMFKEVTGKENKGNVSELKGLLKAAVDAKMNAVIVRIPVELLEIDESYQIPERTARSLEYLTKNWDDNKLLPTFRCSTLGRRQGISVRWFW